jgi:hypothetical protein
MANNTLRLKLKNPVISRPVLKLKTFTAEPEIVKPKTKQIKKSKPVVSKEKRPPFAILAPEYFFGILYHFKTKYPHCFSDPIKPLAIGIIKDMLKERTELELSGIKIRKFCNIYCNTPEYKAALKLGASRVDLRGNVTGLVEENHTKISKK